MIEKVKGDLIGKGGCELNDYNLGGKGWLIEKVKWGFDWERGDMSSLIIT